MLEGLKPFYNNVLRPFGRVLSRVGLRPNHVTIMGLALFGVAGYFSSTGRWYLALAMLIVGACMDGLDGLIARETGQKTIFGAILDSSCDRFTEIFLLLGLLVFYMRYPGINLDKRYIELGMILCFTSITSSIMVSYVKARCEGAGVSCSRGILQRPERIIILGIGLVSGPSIMVWVLGILSILATFTVIERLIYASQKCKSIDRETNQTRSSIQA